MPIIVTDTDQIHALLRKYFGELERELTQDMLQVSKAYAIEDGETLLQAGQHVRNTMFVLDGSVKIFREDEEGSEFFMYYIKPGTACAMSIACADRMDTSKLRATSDGPTIVLMVPHTHMQAWQRKYVSWNKFVVETFRKRMDDLLQTFDYVAFRSLDERLEFYLKRMAKDHGSKDLRLSHQDIATDLNTSREVISRLLKKMEQRGLIEMHRQHLRLLK